MPEMQFTVAWPDGGEMRCYSPSLVIEEHLAPGTSYALDDFLTRSRTALKIASQRVQQRYGFPCSRALGQLAQIEQRAQSFGSEASVTVLAFRRL